MVFLPCERGDVSWVCTCPDWRTDSGDTGTDALRCVSGCAGAACSVPPTRSCTRCNGAASRTCVDSARVLPVRRTSWMMHHTPDTHIHDITTTSTGVSSHKQIVNSAVLFFITTKSKGYYQLIPMKFKQPRNMLKCCPLAQIWYTGKTCDNKH